MCRQKYDTIINDISVYSSSVYFTRNFSKSAQTKMEKMKYSA